MTVIEAEGLTKTYGGKRGIDSVSFKVPEGEVFGFLGPNGAGKTTTIRLLMALIRADAGRARIGGLDCWDRSVDVKRITGYVPGEPALDGDLTGGQIIEYFSHLRAGVDRGYLQGLVRRLDLDTSRRFRHYSSGNKRKVVLIQAFMHRPRVLILDEPTSGLDPLNQQVFAQMVGEARAWGATVFLSSHVLSEVEQLCTQVGIIREGRLVRAGGVSDIKDMRRSEITVSFGTHVEPDVFARLEGVTGVEALPAGHTLRISMQGSPDAVVKAAARYPVLSLSSHEPTLEDIFLRYYEGEPVDVA